MSASVDDSRALPLYLQLCGLLKTFIRSGTLRPGQKMPGVRQLAQYLGIHRHTVARAFRELEAMGLVVIDSGRGTFVAKDIRPSSALDAQHLRAIAAGALAEGASSGFTAEELSSAILVEAAATAGGADSHICIAFVECNPISLKSYTVDLERELGVEVKPILIADLHAAVEAGADPLAHCDLVVTTVGHCPEVRRIIGGDRYLHTVSIAPYLHVFLEIVALPEDLRIGIVTASELGSRAMEQAFAQAGISPARLRFASMERGERIPEIVTDTDVLVVSSAAMDTVTSRSPNLPTRIIEYENKLDLRSIEALREVIRDMRGKHTTKVATSGRSLSLADLEQALAKKL